MDDHLAALHRGAERGHVCRVADDRLDGAGLVMSRLDAVEVDRLVPTRGKHVDDVRSDEPRSSGYENSQELVPDSGISGRPAFGRPLPCAHGAAQILAAAGALWYANCREVCHRHPGGEHDRW